MILESRQFIHMGIHYVVLPPFLVNRETSLQLQQHLLAEGVDFTSCACENNRIIIQRKAPFQMEARFAILAQQPQFLGEILVLGVGRQWTLANFSTEVLAILGAFDATWPANNRQILSCDATLRCLYQSTHEHAFKELWEIRLSQPEDSLKVLERKVLGGGLRLVMPPEPSAPESPQIELKIESFLKDTKKMFIEVQFLWLQPQTLKEFASTQRLNQVNDFIVNQVHAFLREEQEER